MKRIAFGGLLLAASIVSAQQVELTLPDPDAVRLDWQAIPGQTYRVLRASNLTDAAWSDAVPGGIVAPYVTGIHQEPRAGGTAFFRIVKEDTDPPTVVSLSPANGAVDVKPDATVTVVLSDETGIDTGSIRLSVAGWEEMTTGSPDIAYANGTITFTPPDVLGAAGETITNRLSVADTLGHALTNHTWSFTLERIPVASSDFLPLTAPPEALVAPLAAGGYFRRSIPEIQPLNGLNEYHIVSITSNAVIFSYSGNIPVISNGTTLVSFDAAYPMYRRVSQDSFSVNPVLMYVTVTTTNLPLTALVSEGSLSSLDLTPVVIGGAQSLTTLGDINLLHVEYGDDLSGEVLYNDYGLKLWLPSASWSFIGDVDVSLELFWAQLKALEVTVSGNLSMNLSPEAIFYQAISGEGETPLITPVTYLFGAMLGTVPVWVEVVMELNGGYSYSASVSGNASTTIAASKDLSFYLRLRDNQWSSGIDNPPPVLTSDPISWYLNGEANARVYVQPKLTVLVNSLAGPWIDMKPYVELDGWAQANPAAYELNLYYGMTSTLGIESRIWYSGWGSKPEWELMNERQPLWSDSYPSDSAPSFVSSFPNRTVSAGQRLTLSGHASGFPLPSYTWYFNGTRIQGATGPEYVIPSANAGHQGTYKVVAQNSYGSVQASCYVAVGSGVTREWSGLGANSQASTPQNWIGNTCPMFGDSVRFGSSSSKDCVWDLGSIELASWSQTADYNGIIWIGTKYPGQGSFTELVINNDCNIYGGVLTHPANTGVDVAAQRLKVVVRGAFNLAANAKIDLTGRGFQAGRGPGAGNTLYKSPLGRGASHGGHGGYGIDTVAVPCYGSLQTPEDLGSGAMSRGGGALMLIVNGPAVINGQILADAASNLYFPGGSGGSILITANSFVGIGVISARGGKGWQSGGGGRIALMSEQDYSGALFTLNVSAGDALENMGEPGTCIMGRK